MRLRTSATAMRRNSRRISSKKASLSSRPLNEHAARQKGFIDETERLLGIRDTRARNRSADCSFFGEYDYGAAANVHRASTAFPARLPIRRIAKPIHTAVC